MPAPTFHQPLSHAASRRASSPFRGAEGWAVVCGVYASVYHDADTYVSLMPVRGGVLDAPRSCDSRAALDAFVWRGRPHPRHPRCARHRPQPNVCNPAGAARAPFHTGEPKLSANPRRAGVEARPYDGLGRFTGNVFASHPRRPQPLSHGPSRRDSSPFRGAEGWGAF